MSNFAAFVLSFGAVLAFTALMAAWLFRTSAAPFWMKLAIPLSLVALCCGTPYAVGSMLGFPRPVAFTSLPQEAELVSFFPEDGEKRVALWLRSDQSPPRAYETELTDRLKKTLREAQDAMRRGEPVMLTKRGKGDGTGDNKPRSGVLSNADEESEYTLELPALPGKDGE